MEFTINDVEYRSGKLNARQQFHVARRLMPVIASIGSDPTAAGNFAGSLLKMSEVLASVPDADCDYVIDTCMSVVQRKVGDRWANVYNASAKRFMYDDFDMATMLQITSQVVMDFLGPFLNTLPSSSSQLDAPDPNQKPPL